VQLGHQRLAHGVAGEHRRRPAQRLPAGVENARGLRVGAALGESGAARAKAISSAAS
jgi:hypothetical protein